MDRQIGISGILRINKIDILDLVSFDIAVYRFFVDVPFLHAVGTHGELHAFFPQLLQSRSKTLLRLFCSGFGSVG